MRKFCLIFLLLTGCIELPSKVETEDYEIDIKYPKTARTDEVIIVDATGSKLDSVSFTCCLFDGCSMNLINPAFFDGGYKLVVPPKPGHILIVCSGVKGGLLKTKTVEFHILSSTPLPPTPNSGLTDFVKIELSKINSPNFENEKQLFRNNLDLALKGTYTDADEFTVKLRELNKATLSSDMKTRWQSFSSNLANKLESMKLLTLDEHLKAYADIRKGFN